MKIIIYRDNEPIGHVGLYNSTQTQVDLVLLSLMRDAEKNGTTFATRLAARI